MNTLSDLCSEPNNIIAISQYTSVHGSTKSSEISKMYIVVNRLVRELKDVGDLLLQLGGSESGGLSQTFL